MRIGVVPNLDRGVGGSYQYAVTMLGTLADLDLDDEVRVFLYAGEAIPPSLEVPFPVEPLRAAGGVAGMLWTSASRFMSPELRARARRVLGGVSGGGVSPAGASTQEARLVDPVWTKWFNDRGIDMLIFTNENDFSFVTGIPSVVAIHDLQHRLQPEFPEVSANGEGERREYRVGNDVRAATLILVDSEVGKEDMLTYYGPEGVEEDAVFVLPFLPADYLRREVPEDAARRVLARYELADPYLFYPAQFSESKNHRRIIEALAQARDAGAVVHLALAGPHSGPMREETFANAMQTAQRLGVDELVHYLGYVPDEDMPALYAHAVGLTMPTFFGPTNIPVPEAWSLGCPVITSDIRGIREQAGDAALLVDPTSVDSIAHAIERLVREPDLRANLAAKGYERLASYSRDDYMARLAEALEIAKRRVREERVASAPSDAASRTTPSPGEERQ